MFAGRLLRQTVENKARQNRPTRSAKSSQALGSNPNFHKRMAESERLLCGGNGQLLSISTLETSIDVEQALHASTQLRTGCIRPGCMVPSARLGKEGDRDT